MSLFNGKNLDGWYGDPSLWSARDGAITGSSDTDINEMSYLINNVSYENFELRLKYRFLTNKGNSGVMYRSRVVSRDDFLVSGYQANLVTRDAGRKFGFLYINDDYERGVLAFLGQRLVIRQDGGGTNKDIIENMDNQKAVLNSARQYPEWNDCTVIAYEDRLMHIINGHVTVDVTDQFNDKPERGVFALQLHEGPPVSVQFKDIKVRRLESRPAIYKR